MNILAKLKSCFIKKEDIKDRKTYKMWLHNGWGNSISWFEYDTMQIHGHRRGLVKGDYVLAQMVGDYICKFEITEIEYMRNPSDQFFAKVVLVGRCNEEGNVQ